MHGDKKNNNTHTFSQMARKPFSAQTSSYVSPSRGLKGLLVRDAVPEYPLTAKAATSNILSTLPGAQSAAWYHSRIRILGIIYTLSKP